MGQQSKLKTLHEKNR